MIEARIKHPAIPKHSYSTLRHFASHAVGSLLCQHITIMAVATQATSPLEGRSKFQRLYNFVGFKKSYNFFLCEQSYLYLRTGTR